MIRLTCLVAILAAASTAALAKDLKQDKKSTAPATATQMTDAEMDKVTAGEAPNQGGPYSVSVGANGLSQEVGGPFNARFSNTGYYNSGYRGALFLVPP